MDAHGAACGGARLCAGAAAAGSAGGRAGAEAGPAGPGAAPASGVQAVFESAKPAARPACSAMWSMEANVGDEVAPALTAATTALRFLDADGEEVTSSPSPAGAPHRLPPISECDAGAGAQALTARFDAALALLPLEAAPHAPPPP